MTLRLNVRVIPRSSQSKCVWTQAGMKVYTHAPPVDGQANEAVLALVAKHFGLAKSNVKLVAGHTSRDKVLELDGVDPRDYPVQTSLWPGATSPTEPDQLS